MTSKHLLWLGLALPAMLGPRSVGAEQSPTPMPLTLEVCQERALRHSPLLLAEEEALAGVQAKRREAEGRLWPSLSSTVFGGVVPEARGNAVTTSTPVDDYGHVVRGLGPFFRAQVQLVQPLWTFGKISSAIDGTRSLVRLKHAEIETLRRRISTEVAVLYHGWLFLEEVLALIDEIQGKLAQAREHLQERLAAGDTSVRPSDRLKLKVFASEIDARRVEAEARLDTVRETLATLVGQQDRGPWRPADTKLRSLRACVAELPAFLAQVMPDHPELARVRHAVATMTAMQGYEQARFYPDIFLAGQLRYGVAPNRDAQESPFAKDDFNFFDAGLALGLRYHWDVGVQSHALAKADAGLAELKHKQRALAAKVELELRAAYAEYAAAAKQLDIKRRAFRASRAWSVVALRGFEMGTGAMDELVDALKAHIKARFGLLEQTYEYNAALAKLSLGAGLDRIEGECDEASSSHPS